MWGVEKEWVVENPHNKVVRVSFQRYELYKLSTYFDTLIVAPFSAFGAATVTRLSVVETEII